MGDDRTIEIGHGKPNTKLRWWLAGLCVFVVMAAVFSFLRARREQRDLQAKIQAKLAALKTSEEPVTEADLARLFPDPKPEEDAGLLLAKSLALLVPSATKSTLPFVGGPDRPARSWKMDEPTRKELEEFLKANQPALEALPMSLPTEARFPNGFANGFTNLNQLPLVQIRRLAQLLALNAIYQGECGQADAAARSVEYHFLLNRTLSARTLIGHVIGRASDQLAGRAMERVLNRVSLPEAGLIALSNAVARARLDTLGPALRIERCRGIWLFQSLRDGVQGLSLNQQPSSLTLVGDLLGQRAVSDADYLRYLELTDNYLATLKLSAQERLKQVDQLHEEAKREPRSTALILASTEWSRPMRFEAEAQAQLLVVQAALAVECYRLVHRNELPESLGDLVPTYLPAVPTDPFTDKPLRYERRRAGYLIYSVGADGCDDGGAEKPRPYVEGKRHDPGQDSLRPPRG